MTVSKKAYDALKSFGLSPNEIKIFTTLVEKGKLSAKELSWISGVPESRIYEVLNHLEKNGWIEPQEGRPKKFKARSPNEVIRAVKLRKQAELDKLESEIVSELQPIYDKTSEAERPDVWILRGEENILSKARAMISGAEKSVFIALPNIYEDRLNLLYPTFRVLNEKGVKIKLLLSGEIGEEHLEKLRKIADVRIENKLFGGGIIVDSREVMIILANPILGIWSDHIGLAKVAAGYFEYTWD
ncbi:MAG: TrmB family transcriptional regulator [Candidatus Odinarchaeia archaeon]